MPEVLVIDDEPNIRRMVGAILSAEGFSVRDAADGAAGVRAATEREPDAVLLDLMMPGELDGMAVLSQLRERFPSLPVVMMSGRAELSDAVRATKLGAFHFLEKPLTHEAMLLTIRSALELRQARREAQTLREEFGLTGEMVGSSAAMERVRELIARIAPSDARVLVMGESGTGKELVASAIHDGSPRREKPFVRVNCAAIPRDLVESEMFGHERGAFTGATDRRIGRFELAHHGTLFLDEVGDLGPDAQAKLLRAIEAKEIQRVGGGKPIPVNVRIVAATNKDLEKNVAEGRFREDLYFRLNVIPDARCRRCATVRRDVDALVRHFSALGRSRARLPRAALDAGRARSHAPLPVAGKRARAREHRRAARHSARGHGGHGDGCRRGARDRPECAGGHDADGRGHRQAVGRCARRLRACAHLAGAHGREWKRGRGGAAAAHGSPESVSAHAAPLDRMERRMMRARRGAWLIAGAALACAALAPRARRRRRPTPRTPASRTTTRQRSRTCSTPSPGCAKPARRRSPLATRCSETSPCSPGRSRLRAPCTEA